MRNTIFEMYDREGSFAIDDVKEEDEIGKDFRLCMADECEAVGWDISKKQLEQIHNIISVILDK